MLTAIAFVAGLVLLYLGGEGLVRSAGAIGSRLGMSPLVAGLTIVAFATSAPELALSVDAALKGAPGLAVGNVVGSNICNIALILGITALIHPPRMRGELIHRDALFMILATLLVPGLLIDEMLSRIEGGLLCICMACYIFLTVRVTRSRHRDGVVEESQVPALSQRLGVNLALGAASLAMLVIGSDFLVRACIAIATVMGVSPAVIGLTAAAVGTSLPELSASIIAARHGQPEMAAGNLIGSNIFNLLLILGVTSTVTPLSPGGVTLVDLGSMIVTSLIALVLMITRHKVERSEGAVLVGIYAAYLGWLVAASS